MTHEEPKSQHKPNMSQSEALGELTAQAEELGLYDMESIDEEVKDLLNSEVENHRPLKASPISMEYFTK